MRRFETNSKAVPAENSSVIIAKKKSHRAETILFYFMRWDTIINPSDQTLIDDEQTRIPYEYI